MRVIAGSKKHLPLKAVEGLNTRPTSDRIKETLFNMISFELPGAHFLDLFAGSGQIGIEALSRGAASAIFVEKDKKAIDCINSNLAFTKLEPESRVMQSDVIDAINRLANSSNPKFDIIFADPPYKLGIEESLLSAISRGKILSDDGLVIIEADLKTDLHFAEACGFTILKEKKYKTNKHIFLELSY